MVAMQVNNKCRNKYYHINLITQTALQLTVVATMGPKQEEVQLLTVIPCLLLYNDLSVIAPFSLRLTDQ